MSKLNVIKKNRATKRQSTAAPKNRLFSRFLTRAASLAAAGLVAMGVTASGGAQASDLFYSVGGAIPRIKVDSMEDRKFSTVMRQQFDFSCGSAALATLLTYHYDKPTSETDAFQSMWDVGDKDRIRELGFSLLEMKRYLESINLKADGFKISVDRIAEIGVPGIALVDVRGYRHFVVVKGITEKTVLLGDPSTGVVSLPRSRFEKRWDGIILYVRSDLSRGKANFNKVEDWSLAPNAPHDRAMEMEPLQSQLLNRTRPSFSGFNASTIVGTQ